jgi:hypothetical protein
MHKLLSTTFAYLILITILQDSIIRPILPKRPLNLKRIKLFATLKGICWAKAQHQLFYS